MGSSQGGGAEKLCAIGIGVICLDEVTCLDLVAAAFTLDPTQQGIPFNQEKKEMSCVYLVQFWLSPSCWSQAAGLTRRVRKARSRCRRPTSRTARGWQRKMPATTKPIRI